MRILCVTLIFLIGALEAQGQYTDPKTQVAEFGKARWMRNLDDAMKLAKSQKKCVYLQFQEVPG